MPCLRWNTHPELLPGEAFRAAQVSLQGEPAFPWHTHDFFEVFLVIAGEGEHLVQSGGRVKRHALRVGDLVFVRPEDGHSYAGVASGPLVIQNIPMPARAVRGFAKAYETVLRGWLEADEPPHVALAGEARAKIGEEFSRLMTSVRRTPLERDRFLLNVFGLLGETAGSSPAERPPEWLTEALERGRDVKVFAGGVGALAKVSGRSREHLARMLKRHFGRTPTEWVNDVRFQHAAAQLVLTDRKVLDIVLECGFEHVAYFYAEFGRRFGHPPRRYRLLHRAMVRTRAAGEA